MRYVFIGAGAIGAGVGGLLADGGVDVALVARGPHLATMRADGLTVRTPERTLHVRPEVAGGPADLTLRADDVLVLSTKTHQAEGALTAWADAPVHDDAGAVIGTAGERLPVLTALNGVISEQLALRWFARVIGVCVWMPAVMLEPGEIIVRSAPVHAVMIMGRYPAMLDDEDALLPQVVADWERGGVTVPTPPDVMPWKYRKLLGNLGNAVQALAGEDTDGAAVSAAARDEARALYEASGIAVNADADEADLTGLLTTRLVPGAPAQLGGSTWQSLQRGTGNVESDYLNGEIVYLAHRLGRTAPVNAALARLMREAVQRGSAPGSMSGAELLAATGG